MSLDEKCLARTGKNETYQEFKKAKNDFLACIAATVGSDTVNKEYDAVMHGRGIIGTYIQSYNATYPQQSLLFMMIGEFFHVTCPRMEAIFKCYESQVELIRPCLTTDEQLTVDTILNVTETAHEFVCEQSSERFHAFLESGGIECSADNMDELSHCVEVILEDFPRLNEHEGIESFIGVKAAQWCSHSESYVDCVSKVFRKCDGKVAGEVMTELLGALRIKSKCGEFKTAETLDVL